MSTKNIKSVLERIVTENSKLNYSSIPSDWQVSDITSFALGKDLFAYQQTALEKIASTLFLSFKDFNNDLPNYLEIDAEYAKYGENPYPSNRACFWMATGSGKTLVLIKTIEHLDYLMNKGLIPKKEILILMPKDDLIEQLKNEVYDYNQSHIGGRNISLIELPKYEEDKWANMSLFEEIKVYYYRSDLIRDERKQTILDYKTYENDGNWYVLLDEAHRGDVENSNLKEYINAMTKKGFLFNFSATFTDNIDIITTCYNFNLEKFITAGYGKNIYLSDSNFTIDERSDEFSKAEKQKQVLKTFIIHTLISQSRKQNTYHSPLIMTLVNSVNKNDRGKNSDLKIFCDYMLKIAQDDLLVNSVLEDAKQELYDEFKDGAKYIFGNEKLILNVENIMNITLSDIRLSSFNSKTKGNLEYYEGVKGREIVFRLQSSPDPFALIRIGDATSFINNYLNGYQMLTSFTTKDWFNELNSPSSTIKVLLGSRAFYEGWDSNRPNIINLINIGKGEATKFVPQSVGRGIRIQPDLHTNERRRLPLGNKLKNYLMETLFIFSSDVSSVNAILAAMKELVGKSIKKSLTKISDEYPNLFKINKRTFDLLVPLYKNKELNSATLLNFEINESSKDKFIKLFEETSPAAFLLSTNKNYINNWDLNKYLSLKYLIENDKFIIKTSKKFNNYDYLITDLHKHVLTSEKTFDGVRLINENNDKDDENDIIHFKHIEVDLEEEERKELANIIEIVSNYSVLSPDEVKQKLPIDLTRVTYADYMEEYSKQILKLSGKEHLKFKNKNMILNIQNLSNHYYKPVLFSDSVGIDWINHIVKHDSERIFIRNLVNYLGTNRGKDITYEWMFSKIDETIDKNLAMPYFMDNRYNNFYPDFIFWLKKDDNYKIIFVDPKGMNQGLAETQAKILGFKKFFVKDGKPKVFKHENYNISFDLKLVNDKPNTNDDEYKDYWITHDDFNWLS